MKAWLWQFLSGYVKIKIEGLKLLQFVNEAAQRGIILKATGRDSYSRITAMVSWRDYKKLLALSANRPLRVMALSQGGLPHIGALAVKRLAFAIGLLLCIAALVSVNRFVLDVRVTGCTTPGLETRVTSILIKQGLKPGVGKWSLDLHRAEKTLMLDLQEISFAAIRINGVVATVNIVEGVPVPKLLDKNTPCSIVAGRDAIVRKMMVYDGQAKVAAGDTVRRGQVLVDGTVILMEGVKQVHARADVLASIWYEGQGSAPLFVAKGLRTGAVTERQKLEFAGYSLPLGDQSKPTYELYETEDSISYLLGEGLRGPRLVVTRYFEIHDVSEETDFGAAKQTAQLQALSQVNALVPASASIMDSRTDYDFADGNIIARVYIETQENIAVETPIG